MGLIQNHLLVEAKQIASPHFDERQDEADISLLVIHNISLPPNQFGGPYIEDFFQGKLNSKLHPYFETISDLRVSSHLLVKRDGQIVQFVPFNQRAWHAGISTFEGREACNDFSIGIELEGADDLPFTQEQYNQLVIITNALITAYPLLTKDRIAGHSDIAPGRKTDPGHYFQWSYYLDQIDSELL
ncbi:1,6-anhydro-N-acetylmuramyl-L-alanine amidase AmpD [Kangiella sp. HZ709]|uniref:1,6-anhydro-N-acetylmuramyl-L-alanine amidase AmpD n=1 Tax=Kangiella sp. HZ709 TaxID=2666328 RepID=UPI0012B00BE3|nr:1,6-anhydro-N-acetylmuramyl-L-alanine amidase AmpD [Kangiella sp. HZ709]MRX27402.1 1,6-anhydro-N-acetylmuramyl-L-alanine amidase AmpD [Kangiella sp. HZ709]